MNKADDVVRLGVSMLKVLRCCCCQTRTSKKSDQDFGISLQLRRALTLERTLASLGAVWSDEVLNWKKEKQSLIDGSLWSSKIHC